MTERSLLTISCGIDFIVLFFSFSYYYSQTQKSIGVVYRMEKKSNNQFYYGIRPGNTI